MSKIFTNCPVTGQRIDTGIEVDEASFAALPEFAGKIFCPHCNAEHEWSKDKSLRPRGRLTRNPRSSAAPPLRDGEREVNHAAQIQ